MEQPKIARRPKSVETGPKSVEAGPKSVEAGPKSVETGPKRIEECYNLALAMFDKIEPIEKIRVLLYTMWCLCRHYVCKISFGC